jgi:hypothetical protein
MVWRGAVWCGWAGLILLLYIICWGKEKSGLAAYCNGVHGICAVSNFRDNG